MSSASINGECIYIDYWDKEIFQHPHPLSQQLLKDEVRGVMYEGYEKLFKKMLEK